MEPIYGVKDSWTVRTNFNSFGSGLGGAAAYANCIGRDVLVSYDGGTTWQTV